MTFPLYTKLLIIEILPVLAFLFFSANEPGVAWAGARCHVSKSDKAENTVNFILLPSVRSAHFAPHSEG
jgi:hypothetical protein